MPYPYHSFILKDGCEAFVYKDEAADLPEDIKGLCGINQTLNCLSCCNVQLLFEEIPICERLNSLTGHRDGLIVNDNMVCAFYNVPKGRESQTDWAKKVYNRDKHTCQRCGKMDAPLHAHHIHSFSFFPYLAWDIDNGITLCEKCHHKVHAKKRHDGIYYVKQKSQQNRKKEPIT